MRKAVGIALIDQAVLSLFNLGLNLVLIRLTAPAEFGRFIFAAAVVLVLTSLQNALVSTPLAIMIPGRASDEQREVVSTIVSFDVLFRLCAAIAAPIICLLTSHTWDFLAAAAAVTFTTLGRETARSVILAYERQMDCLRLDLTAILVSIAAITALWTVLSPAVASLTGIAIGNFAATLMYATASLRSHRTVAETISTYRVKCWGDTQWSLIGAGTTEIQYRSYVFGLEVFRDATALASVQAGRLLLGPLPLVVGAWGRVARPAMARHLASGDPGSMLRLTAQGLAYVMALGVVYCLVLYLCWPLAEAWVFRGKYQDVGFMTVAWGAYMLIVIGHMVLSVPLQAAMKLKELAQVTMITALLTCLLLAGLATSVPAIYAVLALTVAEVVALIWIAILVMRLANAQSATAIPSAAGAP